MWPIFCMTDPCPRTEIKKRKGTLQRQVGEGTGAKGNFEQQQRKFYLKYLFKQQPPRESSAELKL